MAELIVMVRLRLPQNSLGLLSWRMLDLNAGSLTSVIVLFRPLAIAFNTKLLKNDEEIEHQS